MAKKNTKSFAQLVIEGTTAFGVPQQLSEIPVAYETSLHEEPHITAAQYFVKGVLWEEVIALTYVQDGERCIEGWTRVNFKRVGGQK
jgi:hypothetical protein